MTKTPKTLGDAMRLIGRYTESEGGDSPETTNARHGLFEGLLGDEHIPEVDLSPEQVARFEAAAGRGLAQRRAMTDESLLDEDGFPIFDDFTDLAELVRSPEMQEALKVVIGSAMAHTYDPAPAVAEGKARSLQPRVDLVNKLLIKGN